MKSINVNWEQVEVAFERNAPDLHSYIDRKIGDVVSAVDGRPEDEEIRRMVAQEPERYVKIDPASSREQYRWMEKFVATVDDQQLRDRLLIAIDGKGAFRRFKDVLLSYPQERERWFNYRATLLHHNINGWFESKGLEPEPPSPWGQVEPPPELEQTEARVSFSGQGPVEILRLQVKALVDVLPACELGAARAFLEFLRERGTAEMLSLSRSDGRRDQALEEYDGAGGPGSTDDADDADDADALQDTVRDAAGELEEVASY